MFYSVKYLRNAGKMLIKILHYDTNYDSSMILETLLMIID